MKFISVVPLDDKGRQILTQVIYKPFTHMASLLGRPSSVGQCIFPNCNNYHTYFTNYPVDICFLDQTLQVIETRRRVMPFRNHVNGQGRYVIMRPCTGYERWYEIGERLVFMEYGQVLCEL